MGNAVTDPCRGKSAPCGNRAGSLLGWKAGDVLGGALGALLTITVLVNVLFMQSGSHPAPMFKGASGLQPKRLIVTRVPLAAVPRPRPSEPATVPAPTKAAVPSASSNRVIALQRALADYGYGQIKVTGVIDRDTRAVIEQFERERKLPITGQASDRVVRELAAITGRALE